MKLLNSLHHIKLYQCLLLNVQLAQVSEAFHYQQVQSNRRLVVLVDNLPMIYLKQLGKDLPEIALRAVKILPLFELNSKFEKY